MGYGEAIYHVSGQGDLNGWRDLMIALRVVTSLRRTAMRASLRLPVGPQTLVEDLQGWIVFARGEGRHEQNVAQGFAAAGYAGVMD